VVVVVAAAVSVAVSKVAARVDGSFASKSRSPLLARRMADVWLGDIDVALSLLGSLQFLLAIDNSELLNLSAGVVLLAAFACSIECQLCSSCFARPLILLRMKQ